MSSLETDPDDLDVTFHPEHAARRDTPCDGITVTDPATGESHYYEIGAIARNADPLLLREKAIEWFIEDVEGDG